MLYPLTFRPIFKERIWGGRNLELLFGKQLPPGKRIGESWEISDRPEDISIIANGPLAGKSLRWIMEHAPTELLGMAAALDGRFPLLIKILDAQEKLSLQVHPPASKARELRGEPKTELWYVVEASADAELFVGLRRGTTRDEFERRIRSGTVEGCFHRLTVHPGDAMFLPSGRPHAIGGGNVIFEIQQNSDTTYRVYDWNRRDQNGQERELHIAPSLASINFEDFEPHLIDPPTKGERTRILADPPPFAATERWVPPGRSQEEGNQRPAILGVISGRLTVQAADMRITLGRGAFGLVPANLSRFALECDAAVRLLWATPS